MKFLAAKGHRLGALGLCAALCLGCKTYTDKTQSLRVAVASGELESALAIVDDMLGVREPSALPDQWKSQTGLLVLERATLQQALSEYKPSTVNFGAAEQELEMLDMSRDVAGNIASYMYSDSAKSYKTTPTEKIFVNTLNLINYLMLGDLSGARVEAKRWTIMRDYLKGERRTKTLPLVEPIGALLAGYTYERSQKPTEALRYYNEVLAHARLPFLEPFLARLATQSAYRTPELEEAIKAGQAHPLSPVETTGELLIIAQVGRVPYREAKRVPVGLAVGMAAQYFTGDPRLLERGVTKFVNYPELVIPQPEVDKGAFNIDGAPVPSAMAGNAALAVQVEYDLMRPRIIAAALTRLLTRAAVAEGTRQGTKAAASKGKDAQAGGLLGALAAIAVEGALVAADKPDTRSWTLLPGHYLVTRLQVAAGTHKVQLVVGPTQTLREQQVTVKAGQALVVNFTAFE